MLLLFLVYLIGVPLYSWSKIDKVDAQPGGDRPADQPGTNYLIVGSDKADDLSDEQRKVLKTGERGGTNTDTIIVLHTGSGGRTMMSIPRDTLTEVPGHGTQMINAAFAIDGAPLLVASVEKLTGIHIDHYVELGFGSVINTVDAFGGVEICPKQDMVDPMARLDIKKGCQEVDGLTALAYSRSRHVTALSDLDRVARQREVISALGSEAKTPWTFLNPVRYWNINDGRCRRDPRRRGHEPLRPRPVRARHDRRQPDLHDAEPVGAQRPQPDHRRPRPRAGPLQGDHRRHDGAEVGLHPDGSRAQLTPTALLARALGGGCRAYDWAAGLALRSAAIARPHIRMNPLLYEHMFDRIRHA